LTHILDETLEYLATDQTPRTAEEISRTLGIPIVLCKFVVDFLTRYGLAKQIGIKFTIDPRARKLFSSTFTERPVVLLATPSLVERR